MMNEYKRLVKNLVALGLIVGLIIVAVYYFSTNENSEKSIDDSPIQVEAIRTIAEVSTVSYKDEVVIDTVEFYSNSVDLTNPMEWPQLYDKTVNRNIKRRLTLIIKGEVKYGIDLSNDHDFIEKNKDTLWLNLPSSKILDIVISPSMTEVFHEQGDWSDGSRKQLEEMAKEQLRENAEKFGLREKANENAKQLFRKLLRTNKEVIINFE